MTTLRQFRSSGPMRAPCSRGLSLGHFMLNVYSVLFLCIPGTLAAPCLTCFGFQPGCTFETTGKCPLVEIPAANLVITAKAGVGGALVLQNAVSNKYNRVIEAADDPSLLIINHNISTPSSLYLRNPGAHLPAFSFSASPGQATPAAPRTSCL